MNRQYYLDLAASGLRMPIGTDLVLREKKDHDAILLDGERLGKVVEEAAARYKTPLAIPLMDLTVEKQALMMILGVPADEISTYHFKQAPSLEMLETVKFRLPDELTPRMNANLGCIRYIAQNTELVPVGMSIGPFSMMTKLIADPISPVYIAGTGVTGEEDPEVLAIERALELSILVILGSITAQIEAGAKIIILCEPAANLVYLSPKQLKKGSDIFERFVMTPNFRIKQLLDQHGVDLFFHDCGELMDSMVEQFARLNPAIMSLGSSRVLCEDAARLPKDIVLFGNLPTKKFFAEEMTRREVQRMGDDLVEKMKAAQHPFILGSECDVLSVPDLHDAISSKVAAFCRLES